MDVVAKTMTRVAQEILLKQNTISANVVMKAIGGSTNGSAVTNNLNHVFENQIDTRFTLADLNALITRSKRINTSFVGSRILRY
jgi:pyrimidine operon attenuation protein/uracil phosphoribosyltransferase